MSSNILVLCEVGFVIGNLLLLLLLLFTKLGIFVFPQDLNLVSGIANRSLEKKKNFPFFGGFLGVFWLNIVKIRAYRLYGFLSISLFGLPIVSNLVCSPIRKEKEIVYFSGS